MKLDAKRFGEGAAYAASFLKTLANAHRLMIVCRLAEGERSVGELSGIVGLNQSALSQHLARLRRDGIVGTRRDAQTIYYRILDKRAVRIVKELDALFCSPARRMP